MSAIQGQLLAIIKRHFECEHNAREALESKQQQRQTKFNPRTACGFNEVNAALKRQEAKLIIMANDLDDNVKEKAINIENQCKVQNVPYVIGPTREVIGEIQSAARKIGDKKHGLHAWVACMAVLFDQPIYQELQMLKNYLSNTLSEQPFEVDFTPKKAKQRQRLLINPFNPTHFEEHYQKKFQFKMQKRAKNLQLTLQDYVRINTNLIPDNTQLDNGYSVFGHSENNTQLFINNILVGKFNISYSDSKIINIQTIDLKSSKLEPIFVFVCDQFPNAKEILADKIEFEEIGFSKDEKNNEIWRLQRNMDEDLFIE